MSGPPQPPRRPAPEAAGTSTRLAWLDVLRGLAALAVVFDHISYYVLQHVRHIVYHWFDPGNYGVFVFFIISGYIVPASLERKGSVRTFWVSRLFRLYPLYLLAVGIAVALYFARFGSIRGENSDPATSVLSQLLMMSNVLDGKNLPNVVWSLSYEMVFYLLLTALFIARVLKRSSWYALGFAVAAVVGITLLAFNSGWIWPWEALSILALMFTGTMFYRAEQGQYPWRRAIAIGVTVFGLAIAAGLWHSRAWGLPAHAELLWSRRWVSAFTLAGLTFAAGLAFRHVRWPKVLTWVGLISYSLYLLHPLVIEVYHHLYPSRQHTFGVQVLIAAGLMTVIVAVCSVTYLAVERPAQGLGRRLGRRLDARFRPDRIPAAVPAPEPAMAGRGHPASE